MSVRTLGIGAIITIAILMAANALGTVIAQTINPSAPKMSDPFSSSVQDTCKIAVVMSDYTFTPTYDESGVLRVLDVHANGIDPNKAWAQFVYEEGYSELGDSGLFWHAAVENLSGTKGLGPKMLRAGDLRLKELTGKIPQRQLWNTSGFEAFAGYLNCVEIIAKVAKGDSFAWTFVPVP